MQGGAPKTVTATWLNSLSTATSSGNATLSKSQTAPDTTVHCEQNDNAARLNL